MSITKNQALEDIFGRRSLATVGGNISISDNAEDWGSFGVELKDLKEVNGSLTIKNNGDQFDAMVLLGNLNVVHQDLFISSNVDPE